MALECWENEWSEVPCTRPATVRMDDATGSGAEPIMLCEGHARDYEESGAPWTRALGVRIHRWEWEADGSDVRVCSCGTSYRYERTPSGRWTTCPMWQAEHEERRRAKAARKARKRAHAQGAVGAYSI